MFHIIKEVRDIKRFNEILVVLFEEGFDFLIGKIGLGDKIPFTSKLKPRKAKEKMKPEVMLRKTLERLGPTFVKFGQLLSVRPDLVPKEYAKELEKLQDHVEQFSFNEVKQIMEEQLGKKLDDVFSQFEKKPIASASISQVHKGVLKTGETVAVKVQRPNIRNLMETDIEIMSYFAGLLEKEVENLRRFKPSKIVAEFKDWTERELDFKLEARNAKRFLQNFKDSNTVKIPKIYDEFSSERVLTMEFIDGLELHDIDGIKKKGLDFNTLITNGFDAILKQVFIDGIFHADPHPGNILALKDNRVAFVDFGIVGYFDDKLKEKCVDLFYGTVMQDEETILETMLSMGMETDTDYEQLKSDIGFVMQPLKESQMKDIKISRIIEEVLDIGLRHQIKVPAPFVLFGKTIITLEGIALEYDPDFKLLENSKPFMEKLIAKRSNPMYVMKSFAHNMHRYKKFVEEFPEKAEKALDKIQRGTIKVDINDTDIKKLALELDRSSNRVAYGLLIAALLITSAILMNIEKGPTIIGIPILSFFSFVFASFFVFVLFISIVRERMKHW
ncbi:MAG TPA: AarF/ABC1/UbiB kinase family protein [Candidatus Nanoarchaeia archaeon]|nr:AarF/ABC1/UbiB kinase family protein [Candidatus Nanoarchaeia archaeon]